MSELIITTRVKRLLIGWSVDADYAWTGYACGRDRPPPPDRPIASSRPDRLFRWAPTLRIARWTARGFSTRLRREVERRAWRRIPDTTVKHEERPWW